MNNRLLQAIVVDDSVVYRMLLRDVLSEIAGVEVVATAADGRQALDMIEIHQPDFITLDIEMPVMDGLSVLKRLKSRTKPVVPIVLSSSSQSAAALTTRAFDLGMFDFVVKPSNNNRQENRSALKRKLKKCVAAIDLSLNRNRQPQLHVPRSTPPLVQIVPNSDNSWPMPAQPEVVVIGVSTGGPSSLKTLVAALPTNFDVPILIAQHMPAMFTASLAEDLDRCGRLRVVEARPGPLQKGTVYIAPGGKQMRIHHGQNGPMIRIANARAEDLCRPSADILFESAAEVFGPAVLGIVMTGMGDDGLKGAQAVRQAGGAVIAQDENSSVVFGMPRQVIENGLANHVVSLQGLASFLTRRCGVMEVTPCP